jgi:ribulose-phosphate 3-epimerase
MGKSLIAPSILSANFARLGEEIQSVEKAGADWIHVDVMDGHYVPNLTFGPIVVEAIRPVTRLPLDCHLMVTQPERWIEPFQKAGADQITVHAEVATHLDQILNHIRYLGCKAGVSINPSTSLSCIEEVLDSVDLVLIMSVNPGFGGQKFINRSMQKIEKLVEMRGKRKFLIQVDGGINASNIGPLYQAGVDVFVAGSAVFSYADRNKSIADLKNAMAAIRKK